MFFLWEVNLQIKCQKVNKGVRRLFFQGRAKFSMGDRGGGGKKILFAINSKLWIPKTSPNDVSNLSNFFHRSIYDTFCSTSPHFYSVKVGKYSVKLWKYCKLVMVKTLCILCNNWSLFVPRELMLNIAWRHFSQCRSSFLAHI